MDTQFKSTAKNDYQEDLILTKESAAIAVSWPAVFAGAVASAALSLILLFLSTGFGLSLVSPWASEGISSTEFGVSSILGITLISLFASALGGYLAGRLRTRWTNTPDDEVFFRDTAHGFLSWSVATLGTATLLATVTGAIISGGVKTGAAAITNGAALASATDNNLNLGGDNADNKLPLTYLLDSLLRKDNSTTRSNTSNTSPGESNITNPQNIEAENTLAPTTGNQNITARDNSPKTEITHIFINALTTGSLTDNDLKYTGQLVAQATGINQQSAEERVAATFSTLQTKLADAKKAVKEAADEARKVSAYTSLWLFIALLSGAFIASLMAVYGGRQRDF